MRFTASHIGRTVGNRASHGDLAGLSDIPRGLAAGARSDFYNVPSLAAGLEVFQFQSRSIEVRIGGLPRKLNLARSDLLKLNVQQWLSRINDNDQSRLVSANLRMKLVTTVECLHGEPVLAVVGCFVFKLSTIRGECLS